MSDVIQTDTVEPASVTAPAPAVPAPAAPAPAEPAPTAAPAPAPVVIQDAPAEVGHGETVQIGTISADAGLNPLSIVFVGAPAAGTLSLDANGDVLYTAPTNVTAGETDSFTYEIEDAAGGFSAPVMTSIALDPGPVANDPNLVVGHAAALDLSALLNRLATPGLAGDTLTVTAASAVNGTIIQGKTGDFLYEPTANGGSPTTVGYDLNGGSVTGPGAGSGGLAFGSDVITYTVEDQLGDTVTGTANVTVDPGPTLAAGHATVEPGSTVNLAGYVESLITPGFKGDSETITAVSAQSGNVSFGYDAAGRYAIEYTAPAGGNDTITYVVKDSYGDTATGTVSIQTDPGPILAPGAYTIGHGQGANLTTYVESLITPGIAGDTETIKSVQAQSGKAELISSSGFGSAAGKVGAVVYSAPDSGSDTLTYTVEDQNGDTATGAVAITVDPGPTLAAGSDIVGHGQTVNLASYVSSLITPGLPGDTETVTSVSVQSGKAILSYGIANGVPDGTGALDYTAPASGSDILTYTAADQYGDQATGSVAIAVDPGPAAGNVSASVHVGQSIDLTTQILGADQPGLEGDTLTLVSDDTQATAGSVSLVNGDLVYTASNAAFAQLAAGTIATDSFTYTVSDQLGDQATGTVTLDVSNPVATVAGSPYGNAVIQGPAGNAVINAYGWGNTIYANGGNDVINAGQGQATVYAGSGNVTVNLNGYNNVVTGGNGTDSVSGSLGSTSVALGNGNDTVGLGGYGNVISVGNGNDTIVAGSGSDMVTGGSGADSVTLQGYSNSVNFTGGNDTITGGAGSDTFDLTGGTASLALSGNTNMVFLHDTNATITDAAQGTAISISGGGTDIIQDAGSDPSLLVDLTSGLGGYTSAASAVAALISDGHGGALLSFGTSNGSLDFAGVAPSVLHQSNFQIG